MKRPPPPLLELEHFPLAHAGILYSSMPEMSSGNEESKIPVMSEDGLEFNFCVLMQGNRSLALQDSISVLLSEFDPPC